MKVGELFTSLNDALTHTRTFKNNKYFKQLDLLHKRNNSTNGRQKSS